MPDKTTAAIPHRLAAILDELPMAVVLVDAGGRILGRAGQAGHVFRDAIPSQDPERRQRWSIRDAGGCLLHPSQWPSKRALSGEVNHAGVVGRYNDGADDLNFRIVSVPTLDPMSEVAAVTFIHRINTPGREPGDRQTLLEQRLIDTLVGAIATTHRGRIIETPSDTDTDAG